MSRKLASWNLNLDCNFFGCVHTWCLSVHCMSMLLARHQIKCECTLISQLVLVPEYKVNIF